MDALLAEERQKAAAALAGKVRIKSLDRFATFPHRFHGCSCLFQSPPTPSPHRPKVTAEQMADARVLAESDKVAEKQRQLAAADAMARRDIGRLQQRVGELESALAAAEASCG